MALKVFYKDKMSLFDLNQAHSEYQLTKKLVHPNILAQRGFFEDSNIICIVYDLMQTDLRDLLSDCKQRLAEEQVC